MIKRPRYFITPPLLLLAAAGRREQSLAGALEGDGLRVGDGRSILGAAPLDGDDVAGLHRVARPAFPDERVRPTELERPVRGLAGGVLDVDVEPAVRIGPLDLRDRS